MKRKQPLHGMGSSATTLAEWVCAFAGPAGVR